jgi:hypothetical protein
VLFPCFFVFNATNKDMLDQAIPNKAARMKIIIAPAMPEAMFASNAKPITNIIATWMTVVSALLKKKKKIFLLCSTLA